MLQELGFVDIRIVLSDTLMEVPEPEQEVEENEGGDDNEKEDPECHDLFNVRLRTFFRFCASSCRR
jgi:hypothetical protein